nr:chain length factor [Streptomyces sp.]
MTTGEKSPLRAPLGILATATASHGTGGDDDIPLPRLPGFVESAFSPLAYEVSRRCLTERPGEGSRTAVVLASLLGDTTTADLASTRMVSGKVHNPLLFMQATPNSVLGHTSREFGITGQMFSVSGFDDPVTELLAMADLLLEDPELDRVLVLGVELGGGERVTALHRELTAGGTPGLPASAGLAAAALLGRPGAEAPVTILPAEAPAPAPAPGAVDRPGGIQGLFDLAAAHRRLLRDGGTRLLPGPGPAAFVLTAHNESNETETHAHQ